jgi:hypothetical protein
MISGKSFADKCKWVIDNRYPQRQQFHYAMASWGDWVFINGDMFQEFVRRLPYVTLKKFVLVVHNSDLPFGLANLQAVQHAVIHVYAINTTIRHPLLTTIPIGFADRQLPFLASWQRPDVPREIEIYMNFTIATNARKRKACAEAFKDDPRVVVRERLSVEDYYADLSRSKFVLCPEGTGIDTHRVYESILCGATPVVLRNSLSHMYVSMPVCIIDKWTDPFYVPVGKTLNTSCERYLA